MDANSLAKGLVYGGIGSCSAEVVTLPVDVVKTRLQMDGARQQRLYSGSMNCAAQLLRSEGPSAFFKGLTPALLRQSTYGSLRYGLYVPARNMLGVDPSRPKEIPMWKKVAAGAGVGAAASGLCNPTDLVKVRLQTDGMLKASDGSDLPRRYSGVLDCLKKIVSEEGVLGLWTGVFPTMGRATALAAAELSVYDEVKCQLRHHGVIEQDGLLLHTSTSFVSGYAATVASSPFDVVKSRLMGQAVDARGKGVLYSGMVDCFVKLVREEGFMSLYKGFWPNFGRILPRVCITFVTMEQLKARFG
eukprot:TRINITY_DN41605_c0_g1_i1.p1 TRINITY_DN41605_c0_g1~~TRINITY_DN41605_c0_g1_i1.p1  ORF type:complete len:302 (+),score=71.55 TRINITY_DN41605_c0_g1_i1:61-966(+)